MLAYSSPLKQIGGTNPYGEPVFLLTNGPIRRTDGSLQYADGPIYKDCWGLVEWLPRTEFGLPAQWPGEEFGPFPIRGHYHLLQPFPCQRLESRFLNCEVVRRVAWISREHRHDSLRKRHEAFAEARQKEDTERERIIADCLQDAFPGFTGPTSFANNPTTRTAVQKKLELLEDAERRGQFNQRIPRGLQTH